MATGMCPTPVDVPGDIPHMHFNGSQQFLGALLPGGNATLPVSSWDGFSLALRLRFTSVQHPDSAEPLTGSIFFTSGGGLMVWHEGGTMFAKFSGDGSSSTLNVGGDAIEVGVWRTWTVWCALSQRPPR